MALYQRAATTRDAASYGEPTEPDRTGQVVDIAGWEGRVNRAGAAPLVVRLERFHPQDERQAFDADALRRVKGLTCFEPRPRASDTDVDSAEPWRLTLSVVASPGADPSDSSEVIGDVSGVRLDGLVPIVADPGGVDSSESVDPIVTIFTAPDAPLYEGESCELVFWGSEPQGPVHAVLPGLSESLELRPQARSANRSTASIAHLDARPKRKPGPSRPLGTRGQDR